MHAKAHVNRQISLRRWEGKRHGHSEWVWWPIMRPTVVLIDEERRTASVRTRVAVDIANIYTVHQAVLLRFPVPTPLHPCPSAARCMHRIRVFRPAHQLYLHHRRELVNLAPRRKRGWHNPKASLPPPPAQLPPQRGPQCPIPLDPQTRDTAVMGRKTSTSKSNTSCYIQVGAALEAAAVGAPASAECCTVGSSGAMFQAYSHMFVGQIFIS